MTKCVGTFCHVLVMKESIILWWSGVWCIEVSREIKSLLLYIAWQVGK